MDAVSDVDAQEDVKRAFAALWAFCASPAGRRLGELRERGRWQMAARNVVECYEAHVTNFERARAALLARPASEWPRPERGPEPATRRPHPAPARARRAPRTPR